MLRRPLLGVIPVTGVAGCLGNLPTRDPFRGATVSATVVLEVPENVDPIAHNHNLLVDFEPVQKVLGSTHERIAENLEDGNDLEEVANSAEAEQLTEGEFEEFMEIWNELAYEGPEADPGIYVRYRERPYRQNVIEND